MQIHWKREDGAPSPPVAALGLQLLSELALRLPLEPTIVQLVVGELFPGSHAKLLPRFFVGNRQFLTAMPLPSSALASVKKQETV